MKLTVTIDLNNDSMTDDHDDLSSILIGLANRAKQGDFLHLIQTRKIQSNDGFGLYDMNGNCVGRASVEY